MPTINDIVEFAKLFEGQPIGMVEDRCATVRNRKASCRRCVEACPTQAVSVNGNKLSVDLKACVACGACTAVCPTQALLPIAPTEAELFESALAVGEALEGEAAERGTTVIACARVASRHGGDPRKYAKVPCLAQVEESLLVMLAARGLRHIVLVDGTCKTCKFRDTRKTLQACVESAKALLGAWGCAVEIEQVSAFPACAAVEDVRKATGWARRSLFFSTKDTAKDVGMKAAMKGISRFVPIDQGKKTLHQRLRVRNGTLPQFSPIRHMDMLDALDGLGAPVEHALETSLWGSVGMDASRCNGCGMCAMFCPTGALKKVDVGDAKMFRLEFSAAECMQCRLCADVCYRKCLTVSSSIDLDELMDFEPRVFTVDHPTRTAGGGRQL